jgi:O-6-methylguanine DNA methyltransferase
MNEMVYYWTAQVGLLGRVRLAVSENALYKLALAQQSDNEFHSWLARVIEPARVIRRHTPLVGLALAELEAYLCGRLQAFGTPMELRGTPFQRNVWVKVAAIPYGTTVTYGDIAASVGRPKAVRAVGVANGANPLPVFVPCHRVVGADGGLRGYGGGLELKSALLQLERCSGGLPDLGQCLSRTNNRCRINDGKSRFSFLNSSK